MRKLRECLHLSLIGAISLGAPPISAETSGSGAPPNAPTVADSGRTSALRPAVLRGIQYAVGKEVPRDWVKSISILTREATSGDAIAQFALATVLAAKGGRSTDNAKAEYWLKKAAEQGYVPAQTSLALHLLETAKTEAQKKNAETWLVIAAQSGDAYAKYRLAKLCGAKGEKLRMERLLAESSARGFAPATGLLGLLLWSSDKAKAVPLLRRAAEQGVARAQTYLGYAYADGAGGVEKSDRTAVRWWREAAKKNEPRGEEALGWAYENGRGVRKDSMEARRWYQRAASHGSHGAREQLKTREMKKASETELGAAILLGILAVGAATVARGNAGGISGQGASQGGGFMDMSDPMQLWGASIMMNIK